MKKIIIALVALVVLSPAVTFAQSNNNEQYKNSLVQLVQLLQKQLDNTLANQQNNKVENNVTKEVNVSAGDSSEISKLRQQLKTEENARKKLEGEVAELKRQLDVMKDDFRKVKEDVHRLVNWRG